MNAKDYMVIAAVFNNARAGAFKPPAEAMRRRLAFDIAKILAEDNPRFNRKMFLQACAVIEGGE